MNDGWMEVGVPLTLKNIPKGSLSVVYGGGGSGYGERGRLGR